MPVDPWIARGVQAPDVRNTLAAVANLQLERQRTNALDRRNTLVEQNMQAEQQQAQQQQKATQALAKIEWALQSPNPRGMVLSDPDIDPQAAQAIQGMPDDQFRALLETQRTQLAAALGIRPEQAAAPSVPPRVMREGGYSWLDQGGKVVPGSVQSPQRAPLPRSTAGGGPAPTTASAGPASNLLTPEEVTAAGFDTGTVVERGRSGLKVLQRPSKITIGDGKFAKHAEDMLMQKETVLSNIKAAKDLVRPWTTGLPSQGLRKVGGTPAFDLSAILESIKADIGFSRLQEMRQASPTGGALGQVAVQELTALQASIASLDQAQSEKAFNRALDIVEQRYKTLAEKLEKAMGAPAATDQKAEPARTAPVAGQTKEDGYIYIGGDPASRDSWVKER